MMMDKVENTLVDLMDCLARCEGIDKDTQQDILILMARLGDDIESADYRSHPMNNEHQDHKEGEGVKWDGDIPPVGWHGRVLWGDFKEWRECFILPSALATRMPGSGWVIQSELDNPRFSDFPSHRDKVIGAANEATDWIGTAPNFNKDVLGRLYDAGMLKLPGEEE